MVTQEMADDATDRHLEHIREDLAFLTSEADCVPHLSITGMQNARKALLHVKSAIEERRLVRALS